MLPLKIGIIDDEWNWEVLRSLTPVVENRITLCSGSENGTDRRAEGKFALNHGTLCAALLTEGLVQRRVLEQARLFYYPVGRGIGEYTLPGLMEALSRCIRDGMNIVSMSIGMLNLSCARGLLPLLQGAEGIIIVSAASNDFRLTYPAAFPQVIGVKRPAGKQELPIGVVPQPPDGIELVVKYRETALLHKITKKYGFNFCASNSVLVPWVCAEIAGQMIMGNAVISKDGVLELFRKEFGEIKPAAGAEAVGMRSAGEEAPVIRLPYRDASRGMYFRLAGELQKRFEEEGYSCAVLCDGIDICDFEKGWYALRDAPGLDQRISYYQRLSPESVFLALIREGYGGGFDYDLTADMMTVPSNGKGEPEAAGKLCREIIRTLS